MPEEMIIVASNPAELVEAQHQMIHQIEMKLNKAIDDARQAKELHEMAVVSKFNVTAMKRMHKVATSRVTYLTKTLQALQLGYLMMPDMEGEVIAIRTTRTDPSPSSKRISSNDWPRSVPDESPTYSPIGEGEYKSPSQIVHRQLRRVDKDRDGKDIERYGYAAVALRDPFGLDRRFIKPTVLARTVKAMELKLFDEIVTITPQSRTRFRSRRRSRDPIVLGRVIDKETQSVISFLIASFVDINEL